MSKNRSSFDSSSLMGSKASCWNLLRLIDRTALHRCVPRKAFPGTRVGVEFSIVSYKSCRVCLRLSPLVPDLSHELLGCNHMTSRADDLRYRDCRNNCFVVLVGSAISHNFKAITCLWTRKWFSAVIGFATMLLQVSCLCERERLRPWMDSTGTTERTLTKPTTTLSALSAERGHVDRLAINEQTES